MKSFVMLMLNAALLFPLFAVADDNMPVATKLTTSLRDLEFPSGFYFDAVSQPAVRTLTFDLPKTMRVDEATLRIVYRGSSMLAKGALLRVGINGLPVQTKVVANDQVIHVWFVHIPASELRREQLAVSFSNQASIDYGHGSADTQQSGVIHVLPDTQLSVISNGIPQTLRDAWLSLPGEVVVSIPKGSLDNMILKAAMDWVTLLLRQHHTVRITTLPDLGNLVIAPEAEIIAAMKRIDGEAPDLSHLWDKSGQNVGIVNFNSRIFLAATPPYPDAQKFAGRWQQLTRAARIDVSQEYGNEKGRESVPLEELGVSVAPALLGRKLQWTASVTPWSLPPGASPESAVVKLQLPRLEPEKKLRVFFYMNDRIVRSMRYESDGSIREIEVPFVKTIKSDIYRLRIVVRDDSEKSGQKPLSLHSVKILPQSYVSVVYGAVDAGGFSSMPTALGSGFELYIAKEYLKEPSQALPIIGHMLAGFVVPGTNYKITVLDSGHAPSPERNFIAYGVLPPEGQPVPIRFDEGKMQLVGHLSETLINDRNLRTGSVVQLVKWNGTYGIWVHPGSLKQIPGIDVNRLGPDNVAIYSQDSLVLSFDAHQEDLVRTQYFDHPRWYEQLYNQRLYWLVFAWVLLTAGFVYLYVKTRQHRSIG